MWVAEQSDEIYNILFNELSTALATAMWPQGPGEVQSDGNLLFHLDEEL